MIAKLKRRSFITLLGGVAAAWPLAARAQQKPMPVIGYLSIRSSGTDAQFLVSFRQGLSEVAPSKTETVAVEYRYAEGQADRLASLATDLVLLACKISIRCPTERAAVRMRFVSLLAVMGSSGFTRTPMIAALGKISRRSPDRFGATSS